MTHHAAGPRWILAWTDDSGDPDHDIHETVHSAEEALAALGRILAGETWTRDDADERDDAQTQPAYHALLREAVDGETPPRLSRRQTEASPSAATAEP
jgi:hypothetical protein